jgi:ketosteroid isomerase-like protein
MSQENVEVVRRAWNAYRQGGMAAALEYFAEDCVIDAGRDVVIAVVAMTGRAEGSGAPLDAPAVFVYELRDGAIVRDRPFTSKSQALEAVGLQG